MTAPEFTFQANDYPLGPGLRLIEASAGTGKTFSLAHLVLRLLTEENHKINEILVVSFTRATAGCRCNAIRNTVLCDTVCKLE